MEEVYLLHYFRPNFDHLNLRPDNGSNGQVDLYNLGFVQNVVKGQVLAEIVPLLSIEYPIPKFILQEPIFPQGPNTYINNAYPQYLLSAVNGYVFYYKDKISVKRLLNVRSNVDFNTGNIIFVGDAVFHKDIKSGFYVQANNVLVKGIVEGGEVRSRNDMKVLGGARGRNSRCLLSSGGDLQVNFAEKIELRSKKKLFVDRFCMQCRIYAKKECIVSGSVVGGRVQALRYIVVRKAVGNHSGIKTKIALGYDPFLIKDLERCEERLEILSEKILHFNSVAGHLPYSETNEKTKKLFEKNQKYKRLITYRNMLWRMLQLDEVYLELCRFIVPGIVYHGVEINIGRIRYVVKEDLNNVLFKLQAGEIIFEPAPDIQSLFLSK